MEVRPTIWAFDIGSRSIGWAVLVADREGKPTGEVIDSNVIIHSGGVLEEKTGLTRRGDRGMVVRQRRRLRRRVSRRAKLRELLRRHGIVRQDGWRDRNPWWCRHELAAGPIEDPAKLRHLLAIAIPHMARHRGWRNPWLKSPDPHAVGVDERVIEAASALGDPSTGDVVPDTLGAVCWRLVNDPGRAKIRQNGQEYTEDVRNLATWIRKVEQEHIASELAYIWQVQEQTHPRLLTQDLLENVVEQVLEQVKPGVPLERIGRCEFDPSRYRAPRASLLYQRYRALAAVGNLRVKTGPDGDDKRTLSERERELVLERLLSGENNTWDSIGEELGLEEGQLVHSDVDGTSGRPPIHQVNERLSSTKIKGLNKLRNWWDEAGDDEREVLLGIAIADRSVEVDYPELTQTIAQAMEDLGLMEVVESFGRSLPPGRASYSRQVLADLNSEMEKGADLHSAKDNTYGYQAEGAQLKWDDPVPHGGVEYSMKQIRQLVPALERHYGTPVRIGLEIVREATLTHEERNARNARNKRLREARDAAREVLKKDFGMTNPSNADITKLEHMTVQQNVCLYCGEVLNRLFDVELDHIVPRSIGGSTLFENIAAVCRPCNHKKGDRPFGAWCDDDREMGARRLEETLDRVERMHGPRWSETPKKPYIEPKTGRWVRSEGDLARRAFRRRLTKKSRDPELSDADLHSTAYVAREMRARFERRYPGTPVRVLSGGMTAALRREGKLPRLLGAGDSKDRSDRRHHAVDAISVGVLTHDTWAARVRRRDDAFKSHDLGLIGDETFREVLMRAPIDDLRAALERVKETARPILEQMVPVYERRLRVTGRVHEDTVRPWFSRAIGSEWGPVEIASVRDAEIRNALWRISSRGGVIKADPERVLELDDGRQLKAADLVDCAIKVDEKTGKETAVATWIPVRKGWCKSDSIHHARLIQAEWSESGKRHSVPLVVPVPIADVYGKPDPLECELGPESLAVRSHPKLGRISAVGADLSISQLDEISQGDVIAADGAGTWRVTTFDSGSNRAESVPAVAAGERSKLRFVAARFVSNEAKVCERDDLGHIINVP